MSGFRRPRRLKLSDHEVELVELIEHLLVGSEQISCPVRKDDDIRYLGFKPVVEAELPPWGLRFCGPSAKLRKGKMNQESERSQPRRRRYYDEEFKRNAVELLESGERSAVQLGRELGVSDCSLGKWKRMYGRQGSEAQKASEAEQSRIKELERELAAVTRQRDISKKPYSS